ncbi:hypothetical protein L1887_51071 [Cichorium endivia]|nr:hypothetical protein L1887_51071 [Cichorium endivia]
MKMKEARHAGAWATCRAAPAKIGWEAPAAGREALRECACKVAWKEAMSARTQEQGGEDGSSTAQQTQERNHAGDQKPLAAATSLLAPGPHAEATSNEQSPTSLLPPPSPAPDSSVGSPLSSTHHDSPATTSTLWTQSAADPEPFRQTTASMERDELLSVLEALPQMRPRRPPDQAAPRRSPSSHARRGNFSFSATKGAQLSRRLPPSRWLPRCHPAHLNARRQQGGGGTGRAAGGDLQARACDSSCLGRSTSRQPQGIRDDGRVEGPARCDYHRHKRSRAARSCLWLIAGFRGSRCGYISRQDRLNSKISQRSVSKARRRSRFDSRGGQNDSPHGQAPTQ